MSTTETLADQLRAQARRRLDRVEPRDEGRNARLALALLDAACYVETLPAEDPLPELPEIGEVLRHWPWGEPADLIRLLADA
ncbi:hypothetical protein Aph01nite_28470 [Acrocarpospora phusangensis]|uniref:Uncharacterized protein n=1 Tax=Acrocarpospora phusangensis TaxID=1070424 RepID=A0A919QE07_9ACTN|nr:hypothetical protein [Acrocarpospora phusangensis]GIH24537.1 hypothetical protein Aph01nite_28470 [Acrocarpospora phusangensis]